MPDDREAPLGYAEIAELFGVTAETVRVWRRRSTGARSKFPAPDVQLGGRPGWWRSSVRAWALSVGRNFPG